MVTGKFKQFMIAAGSSFATVRGLALATLLTTVSTSAFAQETEFKIGGVGTFSGPFGVLGESIRKGAELAVEMRGSKVLDVPIKFEWEDDETKPQVAVQKATRLISDGAEMLLAPVSSGSTLAIMKLVERPKMPLLVTLSASQEITGRDKNPYTFRTANNAEMEMRMLSVHIKAAGVKRIYLAGMDYGPGREGMKILRSRLEKSGVEIAAEEFSPLGTKDYSILVNKMMQSDADALAVILGGNEAINFFKQADEVGLQRKKPMFGSIVMDELIATAVGPAGLGVNSTLRYHFSIDSDANRAFVEAYRKKYNEFPNQYAGEAFDGMSWFLDVVDSTKSWDKEEWLKAFRTSVRSNSVEGTKRMRACDGQAEQPGFMGKAVAGTGDLPPITMQITQSFEASQLFDPCT